VLNCEHWGVSPTKHLTCLLFFVPWSQIPQGSLSAALFSPASHAGRLNHRSRCSSRQQTPESHAYMLARLLNHVFFALLFISSVVFGNKLLSNLILSYISYLSKSPPSQMHDWELCKCAPPGKGGGWNSICSIRQHRWEKNRRE